MGLEVKIQEPGAIEFDFAEDYNYDERIAFMNGFNSGLWSCLAMVGKMVRPCAMSEEDAVGRAVDSAVDCVVVAILMSMRRAILQTCEQIHAYGGVPPVVATTVMVEADQDIARAWRLALEGEERRGR